MKKLTIQSKTDKPLGNGSQTVRLKFQKARQFLNPVNAIIQLGFNRSKNKGTAIGRAMSFTLHSAMEGIYPNITVNPSKAKLSVGTKGVLLDVRVDRSREVIRMTWEPNSSSLNGNIADDDRVLLCAYAIEQELAAINDEMVWRRAGHMQLQLPEGMEELPVHLYLMVHDRNKHNCSNSQYLGLFK